MVPVSSSVPGEVPVNKPAVHGYHLWIAYWLRRHLLLDLANSAVLSIMIGLVFEVFAEGLGYEVAGGGR